MHSVVSSLKYTLVLGGGGMRGLAHVGVLEALEELELLPEDVIGSSVGSLVAATWCAGMSVKDHESQDSEKGKMFAA